MISISLSIPANSVPDSEPYLRNAENAAPTMPGTINKRPGNAKRTANTGWMSHISIAPKYAPSIIGGVIRRNASPAPTYAQTVPNCISKP